MKVLGLQFPAFRRTGARRVVPEAFLERVNRSVNRSTDSLTVYWQVRSQLTWSAADGTNLHYLENTDGTAGTSCTLTNLPHSADGTGRYFKIWGPAYAVRLNMMRGDDEAQISLYLVTSGLRLLRLPRQEFYLLSQSEIIAPNVAVIVKSAPKIDSVM